MPPFFRATEGSAVRAATARPTKHGVSDPPHPMATAWGFFDCIAPRRFGDAEAGENRFGAHEAGADGHGRHAMRAELGRKAEHEPLQQRLHHVEVERTMEPNVVLLDQLDDQAGPLRRP